MQTMNDLFLHFLKDMYYAEQQTLRTFPQMMSAVQEKIVHGLHGRSLVSSC